MFSIWPYLLRLSVALYFIYPHITAFLDGGTTLHNSIFSCVDAFIPATVAYTLWNGFFVLLGLLVLVWPRPVLPLVIALMMLSLELYINFSTHSYAASNMLLFILVLVTLSLIIYHSRPQFR
jgi:hypothetical protein